MFIRSGYSAHTCSVRGLDELGARSGTEQHHLTADVVPGGGDRARAGARKPHLVTLVSQLRGAHAVELNQVVLHWHPCAGNSLLGRQDRALALDLHAADTYVHTGGAADVVGTVEARRLRRGPNVSSGTVERIQLRDDCAGEQAALTQVLACSS